MPAPRRWPERRPRHHADRPAPLAHPQHHRPVPPHQGGERGLVVPGDELLQELPIAGGGGGLAADPASQLSEDCRQGLLTHARSPSVVLRAYTVASWRTKWKIRSGSGGDGMLRAECELKARRFDEDRPVKDSHINVTQRFAVVKPGAEFRYQAMPKWEQLPAGWSFVEVAGVATDSQDRVYVFNRGEHPLIVFDRDGRFLAAWGEGVFARPHGITIGPDDAVYLHRRPRSHRPQVHARRPAAADARHQRPAVRHRHRRHRLPHDPPRRPAVPSARPTWPWRRTGDLYVTDGYGNARVHQFAADGRLLLSWGEPGSGPGQFHLPHGIAVDRRRPRLRRRPREQPHPDLHAATASSWPSGPTWPGRCRSCIDAKQQRLRRRGRLAGGPVPVADAARARRARRPRQRLRLGRRAAGALGRRPDPRAPGDFFAPHDLCIDSHGDIYVGEVVMSAGGNRGAVPPTCHALQKLVRQ